MSLFFRWLQIPKFSEGGRTTVRSNPFFVGQLRTLRVAAVVALSAFSLLGPSAASAQTLDEGTFGCKTPIEDTIHLNVGNPGPGDAVPAGDIVIHGVAFDRSATEGVGIDRVQLFLDNRNAGGALLANATLGLHNPFVPADSQFKDSAWVATVTIPSTPGVAHTMSVVAHSSVSDHESVVNVPFVVGGHSDPTLQCSSSTTAGTLPAGMTPAATIHLTVSNPTPSSSVLVGAYNMQGTAFDSAALVGDGIDQITIFLDSRDAGGTFLGNATMQAELPGEAPRGLWTATVSIPNSVGGHNLYVYAHSDISGFDTSVAVPIDVVK
jgi:hypothetical protein